MRFISILVFSLATAACVPKSDLEQAKNEIQGLNGKIVQLEQDNSDKAKRIDDMEAALKNVARKASAMETELNRKPPVPVEAKLRQALFGGGYILVLSTTVKKDFPVLVTIRSKALGTVKQFRVNLTATTASELGLREGASIDPDDEVVLENTSYETATVTFKRK